MMTFLLLVTWLAFGRNHPLKTAGLTGYVCTPGASPAGIPSRRCRYSIPSLKATVC